MKDWIGWQRPNFGHYNAAGKAEKDDTDLEIPFRYSMSDGSVIIVCFVTHCNQIRKLIYLKEFHDILFADIVQTSQCAKLQIIWRFECLLQCGTGIATYSISVCQ